MNNLTSYDLAGDEPMPLTVKELEHLKDLCRVFVDNEPIVVHIGAGIGCSTMAILEERPEAVIFSIDNKYNTVELEHLQKGNLPWQNVIRVTGNSQDVGQAWRFECDVLFIDGEHSRPYIDDDIALFTKWLKVGGIVIFHDYIYPDDRAGHIKSRVYEAVRDWLRIEPQFKFVGAIDRLIGFINTGKTKNE